MPEDLRPTRRGMLLFVSGACLESWGRLYAKDSEFWNKKEPSEWSSDEIDKLLNKSPWAKEVTVTGSQNGRGGWGQGGDNGGTGGGGRSGGGGLGIPGLGGGRGGWGIPGGGMGGGRGGRGGGGRSMQLKGVVRWESAKPVLEALKTPLPQAFANHYVISVIGIPLLSGRRRRSDDEDSGSNQQQAQNDEALDRMKGVTYLEPKDKPTAQPGLVQQSPTTSGEANTFLFGFSKEMLHLTPNDKEVTFTTRIGGSEVKTKFNLKEMMYRKELAV